MWGLLAQAGSAAAKAGGALKSAATTVGGMAKQSGSSAISSAKQSGSSAISSAAGSGGGNSGILGSLFGKSPGSGAPPPDVLPDVPSVASTEGSLGGGQPVSSSTVTKPKAKTPQSSAIEEKSGFLGLTKSDRNSLFSQAMLQLAMPSGTPTQSESPQVQSLAELAASYGSFAGGMQEGGVIPEGQTAVVGEGGSPELATNTPQGTVITPLKPGAAFPTPKAATPSQAQPRSVMRKIGEGLQDTMILGAAMQNPQLFLSMRQAGAESTRRIAETALKYPEVLKVSPGASQAVDSLFGTGSSQAVLDQSDPNTFNRLVATAFDARIYPEGTVVHEGEAPKGPPTAQLMDQLKARGIGAKLDNQGRVMPTFPARTHTEASNVAAYTTFTESWNALTQAGLDSTLAMQISARGTMAKMGEIGLTPPQELVDMATANEKTQIEASRARLVKRAQLDEQINAEETLSRLRSAGTVYGETSAKVDLTRRMVTVKIPIGADPETGEPSAAEIDVPQLNFVEMMKPINDPTTLTKWILPDGSRPKAGTTALDLLANNAVAIDPKQMTATIDQSSAVQVLKELRELRSTMFTTDDVMARAGTAAQMYRASFGLSADPKYIKAQTIVATLVGRMGFIARQLGGERSAVLSDKDIQRMLSAFSVGYAEPATSLDTKIQIIEESMSSLRNRLLAGDETLIALFRAAGKDPETLATWLGIGNEFKELQKSKGRGGGQLTNKPINPKLQRRADALARAVNQGRMTPEKARERLRKSQAVMR